VVGKETLWSFQRNRNILAKLPIRRKEWEPQGSNGYVKSKVRRLFGIFIASQRMEWDYTGKKIN
jgi:hypothetical protein